MELMHGWMIPVTAALVVLAAAAGWWIRRMARRRSAGRVLPVANTGRSIDTARFAQLRRRYLGTVAGLLTGGVLFSAGVGLMLARPATTETTEQFDSSRDIMLCADISGSMTHVSREMIQHFRELMLELPGNRIGLVVFNGSAQTMIPLTDDHALAQERLSEVESLIQGDLPDYEILAGTWSSHGSSLVGDGLVSCLERFDRLEEDRPRAVVLATDNEVFGNQVFTITEAAQLASGREITVYGISPETFFPRDTNQFRDAVQSTGGDFYIIDDSSFVAGVAQQINAKEAALLELPPSIRVLDEPHLPFVLTGLGLATLAGFVWRLNP